MKKLLALVLALILMFSTVTVATAAQVPDAQTQESSLSESPIEKLEIEPISIIEGTNGSYILITDTQTGEEYGYFDYDPEEIVEYTITFKDGTVRSGKNRYVFYDGEYHYFYADTDQSYENQWTVGNTYNVTVEILGATAEVPVTITKAPISEIEIKPITIVEETNGYFSTYYDEQTGEEYEYYKYSVSDMMEYTVTWEDGTITSDSGNMVDYDGETYYFETENDQSYENQWTVGNTYSMTASLMGTTVEVPVTIVKAPIEKIEIKPLNIIENTNGYFDTYYDEQTGNEYEYFCYNTNYSLEYTVTWEDGSVTSGKGGISYDDEYYYFETEDDQSYDNPWTVGNTYFLTATVMGVTVEVPVTIEKSPMEKIEFEPITIFEGTECEFYSGNDWETGEYYEYYWYYPQDLIEYTITWSDGTVTSGSDTNVVCDGQSYRIDIDTNQSSEDPWTVGNTYIMTAEFMGSTAEIPVTIAKAPIKKMEFKPLTVIETIHSGQYGSYYPLYEFLEYAITWDDGRTTRGKGSSVEYNGKEYYFSTESDQSDIDWEAGNTYTAIVSLMGASEEVSVTIEESPVENVTLVKNPDKIHYEVGERINPEGAVLRVDYSDKTYEDITIGNCTYDFNIFTTIHIEKYDYDIDLVIYQPFSGGESYTVKILGYDIEFPMVNNTRTISEIELRNNGYDLEITDTYSDGEQITCKAVSYTLISGYTDNKNILHCGVVLKTDGGVFSRTICVNGNTGEFYFEAGDVHSNTLSNCPWWDLQQRVRTVMSAMKTLKPEDFDGEITEDNIDDLVSIAIYAKDLRYDYSAVIKGTQFNADSVKIAFQEVFGVLPDLTLSENYNAEDNTYVATLPTLSSTGYNSLFTVEQTEDAINVNVEELKLHMSFDKEMYLSGFFYEKPAYMTGDSDLDGELSVLDASLIQMYLVGKKNLEGVALKAADADLDGEVSVMDASLIQMVLVGKKQI